MIARRHLRELVHEFAHGEIPEPHDAVVAAREDPPAIGREDDLRKVHKQRRKRNCLSCTWSRAQPERVKLAC
eukprot:4154522-Pleurochrysis_carterae.AAC.2